MCLSSESPARARSTHNYFFAPNVFQFILVSLLCYAICDEVHAENSWPLKQYKNATVVLKSSEENGSGEIMFETELLTVFNTLKINASISGDDEDTFDVLSELESAMDDLLSLAPEMLETELEFDVFDVYYLTNANIQSAITNCLSESPVYGLCATYGLNTTKFGTLPDWDVSRVSDLKKAFRGYNTFNADISKWNTEKVTTMYGMFWSASAFNQDIGSWNTEKVTTMYAMFQGAKAFNHDIGEWNTAKVTNMDAMFWSASVFNQDIGSWNTEKMTCMRSMFGYASAFNQDIGSWNTAEVTAMHGMFQYASAFNQDISSWTGTAATTAQIDMFSSATAFKAKFTCTNADTGPASSCVLKQSYWTASYCPIGSWVYNNDYTTHETNPGSVGTPEACIELVRTECPTANIANMGPEGDCWCQYHDGSVTEIVATGTSGYLSCLLA